jgi:hypothetical protein
MIERQYKYYDLKKKWRKVKPHLGDKRLNDILVRDFNKYTVGRWGKEFASGQYPTEFESCERQSSHRGRKPAFWKYTKHAACHWLVNFTLRLAMLVEPDQKWRIITSQKHSTVWNGDDTLFDFNFQALGIGPNECFQLANVKELRPGKYMRVYFAAHYTKEQYASGSESERSVRRAVNERGKIRNGIDDLRSRMHWETYGACNRGKKHGTGELFGSLGDVVPAQTFRVVCAALEDVTEHGV